MVLGEYIVVQSEKKVGRLVHAHSSIVHLSVSEFSVRIVCDIVLFKH